VLSRTIRSRFTSNSLLCVCLLLSSSCSWISNRRSLLGGEEEAAAAPGPQSVSKDQYNELMKKYETLLQERRLENAQSPNEATDLANALEKNPPADPAELAQKIADLPQDSQSMQLAETVDVFGPDGVKVDKTQAAAPASSLDSANAGEVEDDLQQLQKAESLLSQNKYDATLSIVKKLETSPSKQVRVRAKFLLGEILFKQGEFDLAMQIFEEIITRDAYSGVVVKTLGRLIVCSEKLGLKAKKDKYFSVMHDFFEAEM